MEYWVMVLILGLFHAPSVNCAKGKTDDRNDAMTDEVINKNISDKLEEMEMKMEKIETLLYKVLIATESIQNHGNGTCLPTEYFERTGECINLGDTMCTSIDLLANKAICYECVSCSENTVVSCKHYGNLTKPLLVPDIQVKISDTSVDSNILEFDVEKIKKEDFIVEVAGCKKCIKSQYNYTHIFKQERVQAYAEYPLRCQCDDVEYNKVYCRAWDTPTCYIKKTECSWNAAALNCSVSKYGDDEANVNVTISGLRNAKCQRWEKISGYDVSVTFDDNSLDVIHNKKHLEWTENLIIDVSFSDVSKDTTCNAPFHEICKENFSDDNCKIIPPPEPTKPPEPVPKIKDDGTNIDGTNSDENSEKGTSTTLLIVIIIILLLLLLLYVGYHNHQKISSCINGTEGEAGPPPSSNRRGRMKGKYAPLPRSMEETFPRHDD